MLVASALSWAISVGGTGSTTTTPPGGTGTTIGATTTTDPAAPPATHDTTVVRSAADAGEPLCNLDARPPDGIDPMDDIAAADALLPMMSVVNTYGVPLGQEFRGSGQSRNAAGERIVVGAFVANVAEHRAALMELVDDPDHLVVCRARLTVGESNAIVAEIEPTIEGKGNHGPGGLVGRVTVELFAGNEATAERLHATYGDQIVMTLGVFPYPMPDPLPEPDCPMLASARDDLVYAIDDVAPIVVAASAGFETRVAVPFVNASPMRVAFMTGYPWPYLVDPETGEIVGVSNSSVGIAAIGIPVDLEPGAQFDQDTWVPTASCDPALGHTLPPGDYQLYAVYSVVADMVNITDGDFAVGPVPVTITDPE